LLLGLFSLFLKVQVFIVIANLMLLLQLALKGANFFNENMI